MNNVISNFLSHAATKVKESGHNAVDRDIHIAINYARAANTKQELQQAVNLLIRDVLPFISNSARKEQDVMDAIKQLQEANRQLFNLPATPTHSSKPDMAQVLSNFLRHACGDLPHTGHNAADREMQEALALARSATTPQQQNKAISALVRDVLPFVPPHTVLNSSAYQSMVDLQQMEQHIRHKREQRLGDETLAR